MKLEIKVGIFVTIALGLLFALTTQVAELNFSQQSGYQIEVALENARGLNEYAKVRVNGVDAGYVQEIYLKDNKPCAALIIYEHFKIPVDSEVILMQESMLGGRYIEILPGYAAQTLSEHGRLANFKSLPTLDETSLSIKQAASDFQDFVKSFRQAFDEESVQNIKQTIANLHETSIALKEMTQDANGAIDGLLANIHETLDSIHNASDQFATTVDILNQKLPDIVQNANHVLQSADTLVQDSKEPLEHALQSVDQFFVDGGRVVNRLDSYLSMVDKSQFEVAMRGDYMMQDKRSKGVATIKYRPNPTRYYIGEIIGAGDYSRRDDFGNFVAPKQGDQDKYYFSLQLGKRYGDFLLRGGLLESSAGGGVDYFAFKDHLKMTLDIYDMGGQLDLRGHLPHVRTYMRYTLFRYLDTFVGWDNILNKDARNVYLGIGVRFIDNDVKTLVGTVGAASFAK